MHSLGIVQWNSTRRDHPGNPRRVFGSGPVKECVSERGKKREWYFPSRSPTNRRSKRVGARDKVGLLDKGYAWVPKSEFFFEVPKGRGFSYAGCFLPIGHVRAILGSALILGLCLLTVKNRTQCFET